MKMSKLNFQLNTLMKKIFEKLKKIGKKMVKLYQKKKEERENIMGSELVYLGKGVEKVRL